MTYTPWVSLCMYPGPTYHGNWTAIDGWGAVPPIEPMSEIQFENWRQHVREEGAGGVTLFQITPDGDIHYIRTGQPFLIGAEPAAITYSLSRSIRTPKRRPRRK
jgi:hypothetical protein